MRRILFEVAVDAVLIFGSRVYVFCSSVRMESSVFIAVPLVSVIS